MIRLDSKKGGGRGVRKIKNEGKVKRRGGGDGRFMDERQGESFSLKAPFAPASVPFRKQFALRTVVPPYTRHLLVDPTDWQKKDSREGGLVTSLGWGEFRVQRVGGGGGLGEGNKSEFSFELTAKQALNFRLVGPKLWTFRYYDFLSIQRS